EPAVSTQKTESVATQPLSSDKNGNGVQVVRNQQEVSRGPKDAVLTDTLPAVSQKTPGNVTSKTTVTGYDPDGSRFDEGHANRTQTVSQSSGTVDANGQLQMKHQPTEVKSLQEAGDNRWKYDHVGFDVDANGQVKKDQEPKELDKERQLPWYEDAKDFVTEGLGDLAGMAGDFAKDALGFAKDVVLKPIDMAIDQITAPIEGAVADEIKKLNSPGDTITLSGNLDVKVGLKAGIDGEVEVEKTADGKYQLSAEVTGDVGVGLVGSASVSAGGRVEMKFDTPEEAAKAAVILGKGPAALASGGEDHKFMLDHLSAMEVNIGAEAEAGLGGKFGPANAELSASIGATTSYRVEFDKGKPTNLVRSIEIEGSGAASIAGGLKGKAGINIGGEVTGSVSMETSIPLDASKVDAKDMLAFIASPATAAFAGPAETSISIEGSVDAGPEGRFFTAEVSGLSGEEVQTITKNLVNGNFDNAFEGVNVDAQMTTGSFKDRELGVGAKLGVVDFELNARHRDVTAEGGSGGAGTTVSLGGGRRRNGTNGSDGSNGSNGSNGSDGTNGSNKPGTTTGTDPKPGTTTTGTDSKPGTTTGTDSRPGTTTDTRPGTTTNPEQAGRPPQNRVENRPTEYRVNPATGQLIPVPRTNGPENTRPTQPEVGTDNTGRPPVPVVRNPELNGRTTQVRYDNGKVHIEAGPDATKEDIQAHMETARVLQRYEGTIGKVRQLVDKVKQAITGMPGYGSQGFESQLEVQKLTGILKNLEATQASLTDAASGVTGTSSPASADQLKELEQRIASVERQLTEHAGQVDSVDKGRGFVAMLDDVARLQATTTGLQDARGHVTDTHFEDRANVNQAAPVNLTNGKKVDPTNAVVALQAMPGTPPLDNKTKVEVLNEDGTTLGKVKYNAENGFLVTSEPKPAPRVRVTTSDGKSFEWRPGDEPPPGYRLDIRSSAPFRKAGFSGGHTREAWDQTVATYGDRMNITQQRQLGFSLPGDSTPIDVSVINYQYDGKDVEVPKTLFEGAGTDAVTRFETHMQQSVSDALKNAQPNDRLIPVDVPVVDANGKPATVKVVVARDPDPSGAGIGKINSWWVSEENLNNPQLVP
ncbi:hypothetical protein, partial [Myxococcus fulvus]